MPPPRKKSRTPVFKLFRRQRGRYKQHRIPVDMNEAGPSTSTSMENMQAPLPVVQTRVETVEQEEVPINKSRYSKYRKMNADLWSDMAFALSEAAMTFQERPVKTCLLCQQDTEEIFRCNDCGPHFLCCSMCCAESHIIRPLHSVEVWNVGCKFIILFGYIHSFQS